MVAVADFYKQLIDNYLGNSHLAMSDDFTTTGEKKVLSYINEGLLDIYGKRNILVKNYYLPIQENVLHYSLESESDLLTILYVKQSSATYTVGGTHYIETPTYNSLHFHHSVLEELLEDGNVVKVFYRSKHPTVSGDSVIDIPPNLETALGYYVAYKYASSVGNVESLQKAQGYFSQYVGQLAEDSSNTSSISSSYGCDSRFSKRGFI